jgi:hypothetical protein
MRRRPQLRIASDWTPQCPAPGTAVTDRIHEDMTGVLADGVFRQGRQHWLFTRVMGRTWAFVPLSGRQLRLVRHADEDAYAGLRARLLDQHPVVLSVANAPGKVPASST